ncbi:MULTISPECIES: carbohydrate ABC transporter permease [Dactylosporangium]|uniref:Sugar ABC transporter permease n=2 Tax=Dactylosporangium TaxID=35753 RepID=A0A9W6KLR5_9ACTN|nr:MULTISPECIES: sugar ABC transporter permease [Dactylosporangium]UAB93520.1 sugar ABC transporter permease [Dactylosporangium vinaceum]UWZ41908.1 sugar ABC transporter permease [Dactylosporangium matsuzakiense]GLL04427.1 sugar ABC transporter permease [Dactylosporangium matsuzakiense]
MTQTSGTAVAAAPSARAGRTARPARRPGGSRAKRLELALLLTPALILFVGFVLLPIAASVYYSFYKWTGFSPRTWFGFGNYARILDDEVFRQSLWHNIVIAVLSLVIQLPLAIGIALMLNGKIRGRAVLRLIVFAPYVLSEAITAVVWLLMLQPDGFVDQLFKAVGAGGLIQDWLADGDLVLYTLFVVVTWKYLGFGIILLLAGLQSIPAELKEAAATDGATSWQTTRSIVLPLLGPTIRIWIFLSVIGSLQLFDLVWIMTLGGPANASSTMAVYLLDRGFTRYEFGYGSAVSVVLFIVCFIFALLYQRFALRRDTQGALTRIVE